MDFLRLFGGYSRQEHVADKANGSLTNSFRNRIVQYCIDSFPGYEVFGPRGRFDTIFWLEIQKCLVYLTGFPKLSRVSTTSPGEDAVAFLLECDDKVFLHFVELICQTESFWHSHVTPDELVQNINRFLEVEDLPYFLTDFVFPPPAPVSMLTGKAIVPPILPLDPPIEVTYPKFIRRENQAIHQTTIEPTLLLLSDPKFSTADGEFRDALADYRNGGYEDCVAKCGSALESVMKLICSHKKWPYKQTDTADTLLGIIFRKVSLDSFYREPIKLVATIRNRQSSAHGGGIQPKRVPKHVAHYVINATAAAILLLVEEAQP